MEEFLSLYNFVSCIITAVKLFVLRSQRNIGITNYK